MVNRVVMTEDDIYRRAGSVLKGLEGLSPAQKELVLSWALNTLNHNQVMDEMVSLERDMEEKINKL